jgi:hypothetical protein
MAAIIHGVKTWRVIFLSLPYENATSGKAAVQEMQKLLRGFGAKSFGLMEDFDKGEVVIQFEWQKRRVTISANSHGYAAAWLKHHPHTNRMKMTEAQHRARALSQGKISVYSILRDWVKGQVTAVEVGMMSFDGAFLGQIMLPTGETVLERVTTSKILAIGNDG